MNIPEMAGGANATDTRTAGFDIGIAQGGDPANWINPDNRYGGLTNIFTALGTDTAPGGAGDIFRAAADHAILAQQGMYAHDPLSPASTAHLKAAGVIQGAMDTGLLTTLQDGNNDAAVSAKDLYDAKARAYDMVSKLGEFGIGKLPSNEYVDLMRNIGGDGLKEIFIGSPPPDHATVANVPSPNFDARTAQVIQAVPPELIPPHFRAMEDYEWMFDGKGNVVDYRTALIAAHDMGIPPSSVGAGFREVLESLGNKGQGSAFRDGFGEVVVQPHASIQPR